MKIENIEILPGCISCRNCENVSPDTFKVSPKSKVISHEYNWKEAEIITAEILCPVHVIKVKKTWTANISMKESNIIWKKYLTNNVIELTLETKNFSAKPGQYIALQMQDWKGIFYRNYSITHFSENHITLTIKLLSDGRAGKCLEKIKLNKNIKYVWALWAFTLQNNNKPKVFFVTWTGISPAISMLEALPDEVEKKLYFWVRDTSEVFYNEELKKYKNLDYKIFLSQENNTDYHYGRINQEIETISPEFEVYMCGNPKMTDQIIHELKINNHPQENVFSEWFTAGKEERNILKLIFLKWIIPYIHILEKIIIFIALIFIPILYIYWVQTGTLYRAWFPIWWSISAFMLNLSWFAVIFVMYIRPLSNLFPKIGILKTLATQRKSIWILSSSIIVFMLIHRYFLDIDSIISYLKTDRWNSFYPILSRVSEISALILLITSNNFSQRKLWIWWKRIQRSSYLYFISGWIVAAQWWSDSYYYIMWIWWILFIAAEIKNRFFSK